MEFLQLLGVVTVSDLVVLVVTTANLIFLAGFVFGVRSREDHPSVTYRPMPPTKVRRQK